MGPNLRNCPKCGRVFAYQGKNLCRKCLEAEEDEYLIVRRYVRDHPGANVFEVAAETGVEEEKILRFLREGRLISQGFTSNLECARCGRKISSGKYCEQCLYQLDSEIKGAIPGKARQKAEPGPEADRKRREAMHIKKNRY